jgi:tetratricopeptide (TPR) repeat protein
MRITGICLLSGLLCLASRGFAEKICATPSSGEAVTCADNDNCIITASTSGSDATWMKTGDKAYQCRRPSGLPYRPYIRFTSPDAPPKTGSDASQKTGSAPTFFRVLRSPVSGAQSAPSSSLNQNNKAQVRLAAGSAESFLAAGYAYYRKGDFDNAILNWEKVRDLDPDLGEEIATKLSDAYARRGTKLFMNGNSGKAMDDLDAACRLDPRNLNAFKVRDRINKARSNSGQIKDAVAGPAAKNQPTQAPALPVSPAVRRTGVAADKDSGPAFGPLWAVWSLILWLLWCGTFLLGGLLTRDKIESDPELSPKGRKWRAAKGFLISLAAAHLVAVGLVLLFRAFGVASAVAVAGFTHKWILPSACAAVALAAVYAFARLGALAPGAYVPASAGAATDSTPLPGILVKRVSQPGAKVDPAILDRAQELFSGKQYEEALKVLSKKPFDQIDPGDLNLFLDLYIKVGDFYRAKLTLNRIIEELRDYPELAGEYAYYLSLAPACKEKGETALASQLRRTGVEFMLKALSVGAAPQEIYALAAEMEKEGENGLALRLYQAFVSADYKYLDAEERYKDLKARPAAQPVVRAIAPAPARQTGRSHLFGQVLDGRYQIRGNLGEGAMGVVYEGWDLKSARKVAIKQMHSWLKTYPEEYHRFKREAEIVGRLKHPNIVGVNTITEQAGEIFLVFDFVEGRPLSEILNERKRIPLADCLVIFKGVCEAVHYAHKQNVIHRDLKLANIMLDAGGRAMVVDFGLASELRESLTRVSHQTMSGTPAYMAPEQYAGVVKRESDIYAIGVCLYELLTGELPFQGNDPLKQKKEKDYREVSSMLPWLPGGIDGLLARVLEPEPSQRIADALDFFEALKKL